MGKLGQGGATDINTFVGHTFFATFDAGGTQRVVPSEVSLNPIPVFCPCRFSFEFILSRFCSPGDDCQVPRRIHFRPRRRRPRHRRSARREVRQLSSRQPSASHASERETSQFPHHRGEREIPQYGPRPNQDLV
jgi:hypothetical protein